MPFLPIITRLLLASILGGVIGYERESTHRPAGFRTHILVCIGAALVMVTSEFMFNRYRGLTNIDPARLGAQVISGIGFLGAGTIIRQGFNVKGLTTAASLWAVSCVGLAAGVGFYEGAIVTTILVYITLILLKKMEDHFARKNHYRTLFIKSGNIQGQVGAISSILDKHGVATKSIEFINDGEHDAVLIKFIIKTPQNFPKAPLINDLQGLEGISQVYED